MAPFWLLTDNLSIPYKKLLIRVNASDPEVEQVCHLNKHFKFSRLIAVALGLRRGARIPHSSPCDSDALWEGLRDYSRVPAKNSGEWTLSLYLRILYSYPFAKKMGPFGNTISHRSLAELGTNHALSMLSKTINLPRIHGGEKPVCDKRGTFCELCLKKQWNILQNRTMHGGSHSFDIDLKQQPKNNFITPLKQPSCSMFDLYNVE